MELLVSAHTKYVRTRMDWAQFHLLLRRQATLHVVRIRHLHGQETRRHLRLLRQALHENAVESEALPGECTRKAHKH